MSIFSFEKLFGAHGSANGPERAPSTYGRYSFRAAGLYGGVIESAAAEANARLYPGKPVYHDLPEYYSNASRPAAARALNYTVNHPNQSIENTNVRQESSEISAQTQPSSSTQAENTVQYPLVPNGPPPFNGYDHVIEMSDNERAKIDLNQRRYDNYMFGSSPEQPHSEVTSAQIEAAASNQGVTVARDKVTEAYELAA